VKIGKLGILTGIGGALIMTGSASANYVSLQTTSQAQVVGGINRTVWRVYALCTDPNDYITAVSGSPTLGNLVVQSRNLLDTAAGSNFVNVAGGGATAPSQYAIDTSGADVRWDSFVTIGVSIKDQAPGGNDQTGLSPGFSGIGNGINQINTDNAGWFTPGPQEQGRAGFLGDGDPLLRVLIMQLTVSSTSIVKGTVAISGQNNNGLTPVSFTVAGQTFGPVPAPGALALLGMAGLVGSRRRRA
jgi:MYXO-CTERM domain-containing protein